MIGFGFICTIIIFLYVSELEKKSVNVHEIGCVILLNICQ